MSINLFVNFYVDRSPERQAELLFCLAENLRNKEIDKVHVILDELHIPHFTDFLKQHNFWKNEYFMIKLQLIKSDKRPSYNEYFQLTRTYSIPDDINMIANTDIFFDTESLMTLRKWKWKPNTCFALCRWDLKNLDPKNAKFFDRPDSQDVWITKGGFKNIAGAEFTLGIAGCDNKIASLLSSYYTVLNPSLDIKTYHLHLSDIRNYINRSHIERLPPPYLQIQPTRLPAHEEA
jgi:hypothetical protein